MLMLSRCYEFLLRAFLVFCALEWTLQTTASICCDLRFHWDTANWIQPASLAMFSGLLIWCKFKHRVRKSFEKLPPLPPGQENWFSQIFNIANVRGLILLYSCGSLCLLTFLGAESTLDNAFKTAACCLETVNQYELAERVYRRVANKHTYSTLASWQTVTEVEDQSKIAPRNAAVATVYGSDSVQMGDRYFYMARNCWSRDFTDTKQEICYAWFEKAKRIYEGKNDLGRLFNCISELAVLKDEHKDAVDSAALTKKAATLTGSATHSTYDYQYCSLQYLAKKHGLRSESKSFSDAIDANKKAVAATNSANNAVRPLATIIFYLLIMLASGLGQDTLTEVRLRRQNRNFMTQFRQTTDNHTRFALLNDSIRIDLIQKNFEVALAKSDYLLRTAEEVCLNSLQLPSSSEWFAKHIDAVFRRELFCGAIALLLLLAV